MKRTVISGLFVCCLLLLQGQRPIMGQAASSEAAQKSTSTQEPVVKWETVRKGLKSDAQVLRVWQYGLPDDDHRIALAIVSDADFQQLMNHPDEFVKFLKENQIFKPDDPVLEVVHWASVLRASKRQCCNPRTQGNKAKASSSEPEDPDPWLITVSHGRPCRATVVSQPLEPPPQP